jgi:hypothetical protein
MSARTNGRVFMRRLHRGTGRLFFAILMVLILAEPAKATCASAKNGPGIIGLVDGHGVSVVLNAGGGNGGASDALVFWYTYGGNGDKLAQQTIKALGDGGASSQTIAPDNVDALFANGKLYIFNLIYLSREAHCCSTHGVVQRFGVVDSQAMRKVSLHPEGTATIPIPAFPQITPVSCKSGQIDQRVRDYYDGPYKRAIVQAIK